MRPAVLLTLLPMIGCPSSRSPEALVAPTSYQVFDGDLLVLEVTDRPGPLLSTAPLPPGVAPVQHPFLSAQALEAGHEHQLAEALQGATDTASFLQALRDQGLTVRPR